MTQLPRILCVMGSGETAPTMVSVHAELLTRLGPPPVPAVLLDTPFGFQENADDICERAKTYFSHNVGFPIDVASFRDRTTSTPLSNQRMLARVSAARYVFAGPGSPSYAMRQWRDSAVPDLLGDKLRDGGCITFASAAACGLGVVSLPVYEIYKVGEAPHWLEGFDLLSQVGLRVALIPHYNNAEGGTHDTRFCYMGERRLRVLEDLLPEDVDVLGVDEHTACIFDLDEGTVSVRGRGAVTWRRRGASRRFESGAVLPIGALALSNGTVDAASAPRPATPTPEPPAPSATPFMEEVAKQSSLAEGALAHRDPEGAVAALLAIDTQIHDWSSDTFDSDESDRARATVRRLVVRLGELARDGAIDPRVHLAPVVDRVLELRRQMRTEGHYDIADRLRGVLTDAGIEVRDTRDGSSWEPAGESAGV